MDGLYSVGTNNRYAMFLGEEEEAADPQDISKLVQAEKAKKTLKSGPIKETRATTKDQKVVEVKPVVKPDPPKPVKNDDGEDMETVRNRRNREEKVNNEPKPRSSDAAKQTGPPRRSRQDSDRRDNNEVARRDGDSRPRRERREWTEGDSEGRPNRRPPTGAPPKPRPRQDGTPNNRRKREFERKSGSDKTGIKAVDKREGGGAHNWGSHKDDISVPANLNSPDAVSGDEADVGEHKPDSDAENAVDKKEEAVEVAEEIKELTLDEYKAQKAKRQQPLFNVRRAGEGEDQSQWKDLVVLDKKKKEVDGTDDDEELENVDCPQRVGRQKHVLDIDITFKESRKFGPRPGRGGARPPPRDRENRDIRDKRESNGPRKYFNGPRENEGNIAPRDAAALRVDDRTAFPSLG